MGANPSVVFTGLGRYMVEHGRLSMDAGSPQNA